MSPILIVGSLSFVINAVTNFPANVFIICELTCAAGCAIGADDTNGEFILVPAELAVPDELL